MQPRRGSRAQTGGSGALAALFQGQLVSGNRSAADQRKADWQICQEPIIGPDGGPQLRAPRSDVTVRRAICGADLAEPEILSSHCAQADD
jgi:hypothetical protein